MTDTVTNRDMAAFRRLQKEMNELKKMMIDMRKEMNQLRDRLTEALDKSAGMRQDLNELKNDVQNMRRQIDNGTKRFEESSSKVMNIIDTKSEGSNKQQSGPKSRRTSSTSSTSSTSRKMSGGTLPEKMEKMRVGGGSSVARGEDLRLNESDDIDLKTLFAEIIQMKNMMTDFRTELDATNKTISEKLENLVSGENSFTGPQSPKTSTTKPPGLRDPFPSPTKRMIEESKKWDHKCRQNIMCAPQGNSTWTPTKEEWDEMIGGCWLFSPEIILPAAMGGPKIYMRMQKAGEKLQVDIALEEDEYNMSTKFPLTALVNVELGEGSRKPVFSGKSTVKLDNFSDCADLFSCEIKKIKIGTPPTFFLKFTKP